MHNQTRHPTKKTPREFRRVNFSLTAASLDVWLSFVFLSKLKENLSQPHFDTMRTLLLIILSAIALNGCGAILKASKSPDYIEVKNKQDMAHAAYMGRFLLDANERAVIEHRAMVKGGASLFPEYAGVASTAAIGQNPFDSTGGTTALYIGTGIRAGIAIANWLGPDGSMAYISKLYLPGQVDGQKIATAKQAQVFARKYMKNRLVHFANSEGRQLECILNCKGDTPNYVLKKSIHGETKYFDPPKLYVYFIFFNMVAAKPDPARDHILGFTPKWVSEYSNGWQLDAGSDPLTDEQGHIVTAKTERGPIPANLSLHPFSAPIGRRLLRTLTGGSGYYVYGRRLLGIIATQGKVFYAYTSSASDFVQYEIAPATDATNQDQAGRRK